SKNRVRLMTTESRALYSPPGFLLYVRERRIMAQPFNVNRLQLSGEAVPVAEDVVTGSYAFYASSQGTLVYQRDMGQAQGRPQWVWMDRTGKTIGRAGAPLNAQTLRLSPDGKRVAFSEKVGFAREDLWIYDLDRNVRTRLTTNGSNHLPIWSPDGSQLA